MAGSFLDRLQKDAHASELEPKNTSPGFFGFLTVAQTVVVWASAAPWPAYARAAAILKNPF